MISPDRIGIVFAVPQPWSADDPRNECYPSSPSGMEARQKWVDARNRMISDHGGARAVKASGASIGAPKDKSKDK